MAHLHKHDSIPEKYQSVVPNDINHRIASKDLTYHSWNSSESQCDIQFKLNLSDGNTDVTTVDDVKGSKNFAVISPTFDQLLRLLKTWIAQRPHNLVCQLVKRIVHHCSSRHLQMLVTVVQPVQSRSFIYTAELSSRDRQSPTASNNVMIKAKLRAKRLPNRNVAKISCYNSVKCSTTELPENRQRIVTIPVSKNIKLTASRTKTHPARWQNISSFNETLQLLKHTTEMEENNIGEENHFWSPECQSLVYWFSREWNDLKRVEFLQKLLMVLDSRQMYYLSELIRGRQHRDFVGGLPSNLAKRILAYLSPRDLSIICLVCTKWRQLASCDDVWKVKCQQTRFTLPAELIGKKSSWKHIYKANKNLQANWVGGICQTLHLKGHTDKVLTLALSTDRVASGSSDKTVRVWCIHTGHLQQTFYGHQRGVWCVRFFTHNIVISGSYDTTIRIWNIELGSLVRTLLSHRGPVWVLVCHGDLLFTASQDKTAKLWQVSKTQLKFTLTGHTGAIFAGDLAESGKIAITGSTDKSVRLWDTETGICSRVINTNLPEPILAISYSQGFVACAQGFTVTVFHVITTQLIAVYDEHKDRVETVQLRIFTDKYQHPYHSLSKNTTERVCCQGMAISGGKDGLVKFWDISQCASSVFTFNERRCKVNSAQFDDLRIVSVSHNHRIIIRDFGYSFIVLQRTKGLIRTSIAPSNNWRELFESPEYDDRPSQERNIGKKNILRPRRAALKPWPS